MTQSMKPRQVIAAIDKEVGCTEGAESINSLPRDKQQIKNVECILFSVDDKDEFAAVLTRCRARGVC